MNHLFPIFLKLEQLNTLIVGGGYVGFEKVSGILKNSPHANLTLIAGSVKQEIVELAMSHPSLKITQRDFQDSDLAGRDLVIIGTNNKQLNKEIKEKAKALKILTNVADTPELCDFYLSSVVSKGDLKIAISTNGKSPTLAKRMRELLEDSVPEDMDQLLNNLEKVRNQLKGDFEYKLKKLNELTLSIFKENNANNESEKKKAN
jgi:siroheme synthase-like protein